MCGIVGYIGSRDGVPIVLEGIQRLEYRGYDSAGVAVARPERLRVHKLAGRVRDLEAGLPKRLRGAPAIAHTRWATHGEPTDVNAHPHVDASGRIAVVHNGIVENAGPLRARLREQGVEFSSDTDTEVLAHLIARAAPGTLEECVAEALASVEGTYGLAVIDTQHPDRIVAARNGGPVIIGVGDREMFVASDVVALVRHTQQVVHLDDGELAVLTAGGYRTLTLDLHPTDKRAQEVAATDASYDKGDHAHFLHKEIHEQPEALERALRGRIDRRFQTAHFGGLDLSPRDGLAIRRIKLLGCGSAHYAGMAGALVLESLTRIPSDAETASEFRYRNPVIEPDTLYIAVSQSGETFDTLAAVQEIKRKGGRVLGVVNAVGSTIARACGGGIYLHAGPEISVASTKTFTSTGACFVLLALFLGRIRDLGPADGRRLIAGLEALPDQIREVLQAEDTIAELAAAYAATASMFFIGRVGGYPVALEGAQKLKEVSYIHAEAYPASELKHGPLALIDEGTPTVAVVPLDDLVEKNLSTVEEIRSRRGPVIGVCHPGVDTAVFDQFVTVPRSEPELDPLLLGVPLQLFAYHVSRALGRDIDRPRNLAKSVTVE